MPKKWVAGARIQAHSTVGGCINRALLNRWARMEGQIESEWVEVALSNRQVCMQVTIPTSSGTYPLFTYLNQYLHPLNYIFS